MDAPVAGVSLDIWLPYLFKYKNLGIPAPLCVPPLSSPPDPSGTTVRPFDVPGTAGRMTFWFCFCLPVLRRRQDGGLFQPSPYVGYPFFMFPDLGNLCGPYLPNGALAPGARPVSQPGRRDGVQLVWFQGDLASLSGLKAESPRVPFFHARVRQVHVCTHRHLSESPGGLRTRLPGAPAVDLFVLAKTLQAWPPAREQQDARGTSRYLGTLSWTPRSSGGRRELPGSLLSNKSRKVWPFGFFFFS